MKTSPLEALNDGFVVVVTPEQYRDILCTTGFTRYFILYDKQRRKLK